MNRLNEGYRKVIKYRRQRVIPHKAEEIAEEEGQEKKRIGNGTGTDIIIEW